MIFDMPDWKVAVEQLVNPMEWRLHLWHDGPESRLVITGFDSRGVPETVEMLHGVRSEFSGFRIPEVLARAILAAEAPQPDRQAEIDVLHEALTVERMRVDRILEGGKA